MQMLASYDYRITVGTNVENGADRHIYPRNSAPPAAKMTMPPD